MPTTQQLHDTAVVHRIGLERYSNTVVRSVIALLNRSYVDVTARIAREDFTYRKPEELNALLAEIKVMQAEGWRVVNARMAEQVETLGSAEADFSRELLQSGAAQVNLELQTMRLGVSQVVAAAQARPFSGKLLKEWLADAEEASARRVKEAIRMGWVESQSIPEIVRRIKGTRANRYADGILEINRRGAEAMVRTAVTHISNTAAHEVYVDANEAAGQEIITGIEWVSTLDSRTSVTCAGLDGQVFPINKGPRPPAHINCRSTTIPRLRGMDPFERTGFSPWLAAQPVEVQDHVLGATRSELFRSGNLKLDRFIDNRGEVYTLAELRARDSEAFARIGR